MKKNKEGMVYKLHKALYGLKQAPRAWNLKIDSFFKKQGFQKCEMEYGVYVQHSGSNMILLCLYVDDILLTGSCQEDLMKFKKVLMNEFEITLSPTRICLSSNRTKHSNRKSKNPKNQESTR